MKTTDEIKAALAALTARNPTPWHTDTNAPWNIEDAKGRDVALVQMQVADPHQGQPQRTALASFLAAAPDVIAHMLQQLAASEARTRTKEAQLDKIAGLLSAIDTPAEHETALRAILRVVMDEN
jgi:hypothetical protein